jgi:hypothetical protein
VIWGAQDPQSDVLYLVSEDEAESDPAIHAAAIRARAAESWPSPGIQILNVRERMIRLVAGLAVSLAGAFNAEPVARQRPLRN